MGRTWIGAVPAVGVALSASLAVAGGVNIGHDPVACLPVDRYARISASASPADLVMSALLQFHVDPASAWYSVLMTAEGGRWQAVLPRPTKALQRFEYRIVMSSRDRAEAATAAIPVRVAADPAECGAAGELSVSSSIVVRVPSGAPLVPPVPPGFSATGVVAEAGAPKAGSGKKVLAGVGLVGLASGVAVAVASKSSSPEPDVPDFVLEGTSPNPGSVLSLARSTLTLLVRMSREPQTPLTFSWRLEMRDSHANRLCVTMADVFARAQSPPSLLLTAPLTATGACGQRFEVDSERLTISVEGRIVSDMTLGLPFRFEPGGARTRHCGVRPGGLSAGRRAGP